jgi:DNA-binding transcriptional ArsR family regulator
MMEKSQLSEKELRRLAKGFQALRSVLRLRILAALAEGETNVRDLERDLRVSQPLISWHLTQLRQAGFVRVKRAGREMRYSIESSAFREVVDNIQQLLKLAD